MSVELESAARLAALRDKANATTGEAADTLAGAMDALIAGYGQGGENINLFDYVTFASGQLFRDAKLPVNTSINIKLNPVPNQNPSIGNQFMYARNLTHVRLDVSGITKANVLNMTNAFAGCVELKGIEIVGDTTCIYSFNAFTECTALETINAELNVTMSGLQFNKCYALENIRFAEKSILKTVSFATNGNLSSESIQSIIDGLADLTGGTAQTITLHVDVKAKLTEDQISTITGKNWTLA